MRSAGTSVAASRRSTAFGYVALPANETYQPRSSASRAGAARRSSGGRRGRRSRRAPRACRRPPRACGSPPACRSPSRRRAAARTGASARRAARSRGTSRVRSRPRRPPSGARAARARAATSAPVAVPASCGWMPSTAKTSSCASASSSARLHPGRSRADGDDARRRRRRGARDDVGRRIVERVQMRVRVDHDDMRASSSAAVSGGSLRKSGRGSRSAWPGASSLRSQAPTQLL